MSFASARIWAFHEMMRAFWSSKALFCLSVAMACAALTIPLFFASLAKSLAGPLSEIPVSPEITVFTQKDTSEAELTNLKARIDRLGRVQEARLVSKDTAYDDLSQSLGIKKNKKSPIANPLPDILVVSLDKGLSPEGIETVANEIRAFDAVDALSYDATWIAKLDALAFALRRFGTILLAVTTALVLLVIAASVRLTSEVQKTQTRLLYMFGASLSFCTRPYVWRGFVTMGLAALLAVGATYFCVGAMNEGLAPMAAQYGFSVTVGMPAPKWLALFTFLSALLGAVMAGFFSYIGVMRIEKND